MASKRKHSGMRAPRQRTAHSPQSKVPTLGQSAAAGGVGASVAGQSAATSGAVGHGAASPLLDLLAGSSSGPLALVLEVVGEGGLSLHSALALWQREQDHAQNRAWRRPGGLQRLAGL